MTKNALHQNLGCVQIDRQHAGYRPLHYLRVDPCTRIMDISEFGGHQLGVAKLYDSSARPARDLGCNCLTFLQLWWSMTICTSKEGSFTRSRMAQRTCTFVSST
jgi:hypothetical protein